MTLRHLRIFTEVYRTENITRAAAAMHMTQPAVSRAIQELEQYYGIRLFERMNRRLYVTENAVSLYGYAMHILDTFDRMEQELTNREELGTLRVGTSISIGTKLLPGLIKDFQMEYPKIRVYASISNNSAVQAALLHNELDLGLVEGAVAEADLHAVTYQQDRMLLVMPPDHPLAGRQSVKPEELTNCDLLLRETGSAGRDFLDHLFAARDLVLEPLWESTSTQALINAVSEGIGVSILPEMLVKDVLTQGTVVTVPVEGESMIRDNYLVWHKDKYLSPAIIHFIRLCRKRL